ncbi:hypothetical protein OJ253_2299 [Cryptosporidium canis]|uniref:Uncharacterized protein n=1 Tax=Cryptosporidium canis TaxID=195482 RepID=A0A9D5DFN5_9CRYT|nr:hypothetical protein OJ253_2299 [Cryptosporidium canis]
MQFSKPQSYYCSISTAESEQLFNDNSRSAFGDRLYFSDRDYELKDGLNLNNCSGEKRTIENDEFIETWEGDDNGLVWGKKEAKDKSWKEEWIEQRNIPRESNISQVSYTEEELPNDSCLNFGFESNEEQHISEPKLFESENKASLGQLIGLDYIKNRRWKEKWFRRGRKLFVRKFVQQLCENNSRVINVWFEDSEFNYDSNKASWILVRNNKYGKKMSDKVEWRESNYFHDDYHTMAFEERGISSGSNSCPYFYSKRRRVFKDNTEIVYSKYYKGCDVFEIDSDSSKDDNFSDEFSFEEMPMVSSIQNVKYSECSKEFTKKDANGNKKGTKYGNRGEICWREVWFEQADGSTEYDIWYSNSEMQWGEKHGYSKSSNENFRIKWEEKADGSNERKYIEKNWEKVGEQNSWGEKLLESIENTSEGKKVSLSKKNWYNNGCEIFEEEYTEETQFNSQDQDTLPIIVLRNGEKRGERLTTGETWSENWNESLGQCSTSNKMKRTKLFTDKLWTKKNGEKWGEKKTVKLKQVPKNNEELNLECEDKIDMISGGDDVYIESTEFWYFSELEEYTDIWETDGINRNGHKRGIDRKQNSNRYIEWEEEWSKDNTEKLRKNFTWKLKDEYGLIEFWTEDRIQDSSGKQIVKKKGKKYNIEIRNEVVHEWEETCNDDGDGNTYTIKKGKGGEHWYVDEFSSSEHTGEKWALKRGCDEEGSWAEKWSEKPDYKEAWKAGENRYGDKWEEEWKEDFKNRWKWAKKSGENNIGDQWREEWREEIDTTNHISRKTASKKGKKLISGEEWSEEWGESYYGIKNELMGEGGIPAEYIEKWTNKYATDGNGNKWGSFWGDTWNWSTKVKSWGEKWENSYITEKW